MAAEKIFSEISEHMLKGLMFHEELANYFAFLALDGYSCCHEYHYKEESHSYRELNKYYITHYNKLIPKKGHIDAPQLIPTNWYAYTRKDVDAGVKRNAVKEAMQVWVNWEKETKELYEKKYIELCETKDVAAALLVKCLVKDVDNELKYAEEQMMALNTSNYDIIYILDEQKPFKEKYAKKTRVD